MQYFLNEDGEDFDASVYDIQLIEPSKYELELWGSLAYVDKRKRDKLHEAGFGVMQEAVKMINKLLAQKAKEQKKREKDNDIPF